jgi:hypothetical protein
MATQYTAGLTTGQVLTAATMNSIGAAWESYTPTFTNYVAAGSTSKYVQINKLVIWQFSSIVSTASAGEIALSLPITAATTITAAGARNFGLYYDASVADSFAMALFIPTTTTVKLFNANSATPAVLNGSVLAVNDEISFVLIYEAA